MDNLIFDIIKNIALYAIPIMAFLLSILALIRTNKLNKLEEKINKYDLIIKEHELEMIEKERNIIKEACIEAGIIKISKGEYKIKIYNSGMATAYNIDYIIPREYQIIMNKRVTPFEYLAPGNGFEECVIIHNQSSHKYKVVTTWQNIDGDDYKNEQINAW